MKLGEILIRKQLISSPELEQVISSQLQKEKKLGELLLENQMINSDDLNNALQEQYWRNHGFWKISALDWQKIEKNS